MLLAAQEKENKEQVCHDELQGQILITEKRWAWSDESYYEVGDDFYTLMNERFQRLREGH